MFGYPHHASPDDRLLEQVKAAIPLREMIGALELRQRGRALQCPNHDAHKHGDRRLSAFISSTGRSWTCYGCGAGGTVVDLLMAARGYSTQEAVLALADYAGLPLLSRNRPVFRPAPRAPGTPAARPADPPPAPAGPPTAAFLERCQRLLEDSEAQRYLATRGIPPEIARQTGLGFAPRGTWPNARGARQPRLVAPLSSPDGILLTLYGRSTVSCDKGLRHDFLPGAKGLFYPEAASSDGVVLVEGVFDALACLAGGLPASALCGLSIREGWWKALAARTLVLALDADQAAQQRWEALATAAVSAGKRVLVVRSEHLRPHKDLNEYWVQTRTLPAALCRAVKKTASRRSHP